MTSTLRHAFLGRYLISSLASRVLRLNDDGVYILMSTLQPRAIFLKFLAACRLRGKIKTSIDWWIFFMIFHPIYPLVVRGMKFLYGNIATHFSGLNWS